MLVEAPVFHLKVPVHALAVRVMESFPQILSELAVITGLFAVTLMLTGFELALVQPFTVHVAV
jgi:hypothetical protein